MAKHEQILVLDPPSDLKFKGRLAGTRPSGAGAGGRRRGGRAALPSPTPGPSVGAAAPLRPSARRLGVRRCPAGLRRGGEEREPDGRRGGLCPEPPPSCGPRGRRGSPPAPCPPAWRPCPRAAAARSRLCELEAGSKSSGVCGRQRATFGAFGQARPAGEALTTAGLARSLPCQVPDSVKPGDPAVFG